MNVEFKCTNKINNVINELLEDNTISNSILSELQVIKNQAIPSISFHLLQKLCNIYSKKLKPSEKHKALLHVITKGSEILPYSDTPKREQSAEMKARLNRLRLKQEQREYDSLMGKKKEPLRFNDSAVPKGLQYELGLGLNIIALMATGFVVFYWIGKMVFPHDQVKCTLCGAVGLFLAMILEMLLFMIREEKAKRQYKMSKKTS